MTFEFKRWTKQSYVHFHRRGVDRVRSHVVINSLFRNNIVEFPRNRSEKTKKKWLILALNCEMGVESVVNHRRPHFIKFMHILRVFIFQSRYLKKPHNSRILSKHFFFFKQRKENCAYNFATTLVIVTKQTVIMINKTVLKTLRSKFRKQNRHTFMCVINSRARVCVNRLLQRHTNVIMYR